jgi:outer membrane protein assembly factor BamB
MFPLLSTPSEPPMIVAAGGQKLRAFRADREGGEITWETNLDATICSAPARGEKIGRIFFGTADNQFHALDAHGRERWKFAAGGKVVTQSVVTDDVMVIFGCDDGQVYGLNAETGSIKWKFGAFASATSAPGIAAGLLIVGSTDGLVYALEPQTGEKKWSYKATASIHAPIVGAGELIYLATKAGEIVALDSKTGDTRWTNSFGGSAEAAMALGKENLFVVEGGQVTAISLQTGSQLWQTPAEEYVGAPLLAENTLVVARRSGTVRRLDFAGSIREEWKASKKEGQSAASFTFGPVTGGGALWLADDEGGMWRLAPVVSKSDSK